MAREYICHCSEPCRFKRVEGRHLLFIFWSRFAWGFPPIISLQAGAANVFLTTMKKEEVIAMKADGREAFETRDAFLLCALMAVGIEPVSSERVRVILPEHISGREFVYHLKARSGCGKYETGALIKAWGGGLEWIEKNPEHPFAYAMAAALNFKNNEEWMRTRAGQVYLVRGNSVALVPLNATAEIEEKLLGDFGRK